MSFKSKIRGKKICFFDFIKKFMLKRQHFVNIYLNDDLKISKNALIVGP